MRRPATSEQSGRSDNAENAMIRRLSPSVWRRAAADAAAHRNHPRGSLLGSPASRPSPAGRTLKRLVRADPALAALLAASPKPRPISGISSAADAARFVRLLDGDPDAALAALLAETAMRAARPRVRRPIDARSAPHEGGGGAFHRARRYRRRLAGRAGDTRARPMSPTPRSASPSGICLRDAVERKKLAPPDRGHPETGSRLHRARHGQDGRPRAQFFKRHRPHGVFRSGRRAGSPPDVEPAPFYVV